MKIGVLGTGVVGQTLAAKLVALGHDVVIGTRDPAATLARSEKGPFGSPPFREWHAANPKVKLEAMAAACAHAELAFNVLAGQASVEALRGAADALAGKVLIDVANPLDFSKGMPPSLSVSNTDSLGEQIQRALPRTKVVKTLNTVNALLMVDPGQLAGGDHTMFMSGDDADAKAMVSGFLKESFGWKDVVDLGDITTARGTEMYLPLWVRLYGSLKTPMFSVKLVR
ncbi:MAG: NAD(P)-binding domain-containing protein [Polyangiaceae bacterium]|nr:NAD(P)-binding domain-containing protein [Polyangiaceae bacterium]MBK8940624.1 NAD(P)-binding domain-containing protein [Polyangiaceae bacterium]